MNAPGVSLLLVLWLLIGVCPAFGHASLISTDPPNGSVLVETPAQVVLTFNEPTGLLAATLIHSDGSRISFGERAISTAGSRIILTLPARLENGTSALSWRAASGDGHPISGTLLFSVGAPSGDDPVEEAADPAVRGLLWLARAAMFLGLLLGAGSSSFRIVAPALPAGSRQLSLAILPLGGLAVLASIPLQGLDALGRPLGDVAAPEVWQAAFATGYGASAMAALLALILAGVAVAAQRPRLAGWVAVCSLIAIGLTVSLSGHASSASPQWLTRPMVFLHVASIAWWAGELLPLALVLKLDQAVADSPLMRFSRLIPFAIAPLVVSGLTLAAIQLGLPGPSWRTPYGYIFAAKLMLLLVLFAVAGWNRWVLTARVIAGMAAANRRMRRAILVELALIVGIVGLAAGWRFTPPPRSLASLELPGPASVSVALAEGDLVAEATIQPASAGSNRITIVLKDQDGAPMQAKSVAVTFANAELGIEPIRGIGVGADEAWRLNDIVVPLPGEWEVVIEARISDFKMTRLKGTVAFGP